MISALLLVVCCASLFWAVHTTLLILDRAAGRHLAALITITAGTLTAIMIFGNGGTWTRVTGWIVAGAVTYVAYRYRVDVTNTLNPPVQELVPLYVPGDQHHPAALIKVPIGSRLVTVTPSDRRISYVTGYDDDTHPFYPADVLRTVNAPRPAVPRPNIPHRGHSDHLHIDVRARRRSRPRRAAGALATWLGIPWN